MPWYDKTWDALGYNRGDIDFFAIDYSRFGGINAALTAECRIAFEVAGLAHRVAYHPTDIEWELVSVDTASRTQTVGHHHMDGATSAGTGGCTEHGFWPALRQCDRHQTNRTVTGGQFHNIMRRQSTLIIYTTLAPCLCCCNAMYGLSRELDMNILVRCQQDYDFLGIRAPYDFTVMIPRQTKITSVRKPAPADRCVFVLHDGQMDFSGRHNLAEFLGSIRPIDPKCNPHRDDDQRTCGSINVAPWSIPHNPQCDTCMTSVTVSERGSGLPWANHYDPDWLANTG